MSLVIADRVKETTVTTGTGPLALGGAISGFRAFSAVCSVADIAYYAVQAVDANGTPTGDWEVGLGTYSGAATLTRTTPLASSNANAAVNFSAGTKQVWIDLAAAQIIGGAPLASPAFTGVPTAPTAAPATNTTQLATTAYADAIAALKANIASPTFTGTATSPTFTATTKFLIPDGLVSALSLAFASAPTNGWFYSGGSPHLAINGVDAFAWDGSSFYIFSASGSLKFGASNDVVITRDGAADVLAQKRANNDQIFRKYGANGGYQEWGSISELLTLSTVGATTDTAANLLPANANIEAVTARVTTTITTATDWKLGDATIAGRFSAANATLVAGTTQVGLVHIDQTGTSGPRQTAAAKLRVTTTGTPGAGVIRITVYYSLWVPPTS